MVKISALEKIVEKSLREWRIDSSPCLIVGVSGGVDSMTLLTILSKLFYGKKSSLVVVHVHHGLRKTATRDAKLVAKYAEELGVSFVMRQVRLVGKGLGVEEEARKLRYQALREEAVAHGAKYLAVAHTADDQVETILFNFLRGAGLRGLSGMRELADDVWRPLRAVRKKEIMEYAQKHNVPYLEDETNLSTEFTRNRIRLELLPILRSYNSRVDDQIFETGELMTQASGVVDKVAERALVGMAKISDGRVEITGSKFRELDRFMQAEVIKAAMKRLSAELVGLGQAHFEEAIRFAINFSGKAATKRIGGQLWLRRSYDKITVSKTSK